MPLNRGLNYISISEISPFFLRLNTTIAPTSASAIAPNAIPPATPVGGVMSLVFV